MKENFNLLGISPSTIKSKWGSRRVKRKDGKMKANAWSQITSENVNQYWLIFDCFWACWSIENWVFRQLKERKKPLVFSRLCLRRGWFSRWKMIFGCVFYVLRRYSTNDRHWKRSNDSTRDCQIKIEGDSLEKKYYPEFRSGRVEDARRQWNFNGLDECLGWKISRI